jgi:predicted AlkP superfamily pyrophosphatase or phosphodiesterase
MTRRAAFVFALLFSLASRLSLPAAIAAERPALVVLVSVDQFAYEYLERFRNGFVPEGFVRRCETGGAWFTNCHHQFAYTFTGPGHSVLGSGAYPCDTGIVGNEMYDRANNRLVYAVADPDAVLIGKTADDQPVSPRSLLCDTLGDRLKIATHGRAKVFSVAIKDRAAILLVGRGADAAFWMSNAGEWITCDFYRRDIPGYLRQLNQAVPQLAGQSWNLLWSAEAYQHGVVEDDFGEQPAFGMTPGFPHVLVAATDKDFVKQLAGSAFGNDVTLAAAREVLSREQLGQDDVPDLLTINLSSNDYVGHAFGPHSLEVEDITYRTDQALGRLADFVNEQLRGRYWLMVVTGDHGVAPIPELAEQRFKIPARREPLGKTDKSGNWVEIAAPLDAYLRAALQVPASEPSVVQAVTEYQVYFHQEHPSLAGERHAVAERLARDWLLRNPFIVAAVTREQLLSGQIATRLEQAFRRSFHPVRGGDVLFALQPYHFQGSKGATTHGSPWHYDTHVPLLVLGQKEGASAGPWNHGRVAREISTTAIVPTIAALLGVDPPSLCRTEPLPELLPQSP